MIKWIVVIALIVLLSGLLQSRPTGGFRLGELPGDLRLRFGGRHFRFPFTSTVLLSLAAWLLLRFF